MGRNKNNEVSAALLPQELGFDSGMTCWRRLRDWHAAGVWHEFHLTEAARCTAQVEKLDFIRFSMFGASVLSPARRTVHRPQTDGLGQAGQQASHHLGNPRYRRDALRHRVNRHDSVAFEELVDTLPAVGRQRAGHAAGPGKCLRSPGTAFSSGESSRNSQCVLREVRRGFFAMSRSMRRRAFLARNWSIFICSGERLMLLSLQPAPSNSPLADTRTQLPRLALGMPSTLAITTIA